MYSSIWHGLGNLIEFAILFYVVVRVFRMISSDIVPEFRFNDRRQMMTADEKALLLTVARIVRGQLKDIPDPKGDDKLNLDALNEALKPFDPSPSFDHGGCASQKEGRAYENLFSRHQIMEGIIVFFAGMILMWPTIVYLYQWIHDWLR